ncbi:MAG: adenylate/guanylate cyclase domain-containing protein [Alphaproteobacteria bacterium]
MTAASTKGRFRHRPKISFRLSIAAIFSVLALANAALISWYNHRESTHAAADTAQQLMDEAGAKVTQRVTALFEPATALADLAASMPDIAQKPDIMVHPTAWYLMRALTTYPQIYSAYMGYEDGDFHQIISVANGGERVAEELGAPPGTLFALRTILRRPDGTRFQFWSFLDRERRMVGSRIDGSVAYDPRSRGWYRSAIGARQQIASTVYMFQSLRAPGLTMARRFDGEVPGVFGIDVTLEALSEFLADNPVSPHGRVLLFDRDGQVIAFSDPNRTTSADESDGTLHPARIAELGERALDTLLRLRPEPNGLRESLVFQEAGQSYLARLAPLPANIAEGGRLAVLAPLTDFTGVLDRTRRNSMIFATIAVAASMLLVVFFSKRMAHAIELLVEETDRIRQFDLEEHVDLGSRIKEIDKLAVSIDGMKAALRNFARFVPTDIVRRIVESGDALEIGGRRQPVTMMFTDVAGYTTMAERVAPEELMRRTSRYFDEMTAGVTAHRGVVDKFIGDAVMALWNAPTEDPDHVAHACEAALDCRDRVAAFNRDAVAKGMPPLPTRFGVHTAEAVVGNVGSADRMNYTAMGSAVNMAARLEGLNKVYGTTILVSADVVAATGGRFLCRRIDRVLPKGALTSMEVHELLSQRPADPALERMAVDWAAAMDAHDARDWVRAAALFEAFAAAYPADGAAQRYAERCTGFKGAPPAADWAGVTVMESK